MDAGLDQGVGPSVIASSWGGMLRHGCGGDVASLLSGRSGDSRILVLASNVHV